MNDDLMNNHKTATDEMEQRLRAYADARLSPTRDAVECMRATIVARAAAQAATRDVQRPFGALIRGSWWPIRSRRAVGALLAACLTVGSAAAVFGAVPGSPLYGTRLWLESLTLPSSGDARVAAQVAQLDQRDAELEQASLADDGGAVKAALAAFDQEIANAVHDAGNDPGRLAHLEAELQKHIAVLRGVEATAPASAVPAIEAAIAASSKAIQEIEARLQQLPTPTPGHTPAPHPTPGPKPTNPRTPSAAPHPTPGPKPTNPRTPTLAPHRTRANP
jgi:hypothetical protein